MSESFVNVTEGSGKKLHTDQKTIGANDVHDEYVVPGEIFLPTYSIIAVQLASLAANDHLIQVMAGASLKVRIRNIAVMQAAAASGVAPWAIQIWRLTTAGTGGTAVTPRPLDSSDAAAGCTAMTKPTAKGTEGVQLMQQELWAGTAAIPTVTNRFEWEQDDNAKGIIIPSGTTNGIAIKCPTATPTNATWTIYIEVVETAF